MAFLPLRFNGGFLFCCDVFTEHFDFSIKAATKHDIGTAASHIGSDSHRARLTSISNDLGFFFVEFSVQNLMGNFGIS